MESCSIIVISTPESCPAKIGSPSFCQDMTMGSSPAVMEQRMESRWSCLSDWLGKPGDWRLGGAAGGAWERVGDK